MKKVIFKAIFVISFVGLASLYPASIQTTNRILARVGKHAITVLDVKKEMDRQLYIKDKNLLADPNETFSFYAQNWKMVLNKITQDEMLLLEAESLEYKIPTHEISKRVSVLFGDNTVEALKLLNITPERAREISNREIISEHFAWFQVWSKSFMEATPSTVHKAYEQHIADLAKKDKWTYQALYVKGADEGLVKDTTKSITTLLSKGEFTNLSTIIDQIDFHDERVKVGVSQDITLEKGQLSPKILTVLEKLDEGMMSEVIAGKSSNAFTNKILYLKERKKEHIPGFAEMNDKLKNEIVNKVGTKIASDYYEDLYKKYDVDGLWGEKLGTSQLEPFALSHD